MKKMLTVLVMICIFLGTTSAIAAANKGAVIKSSNKTWNKYYNYDLGFQIKIPKKIVVWSGNCLWDGSSYRLEQDTLGVSAYSEKNIAYVAPDYVYELGDENVQENEDGSETTYFGSCYKQMNSVENLKKENNYHKWIISINTINSEKELDTFIKQKYGKTCSLGKLTATGKNDLYDVEIKGDGKDTKTTQCFINGIYVIKYSPGLKKMANWDIGQDYSFYSTSNKQYDIQMKDSFSFIK